MEKPGAQIEFSQVGLTYANGSEQVEACRTLSFVIVPGESVAFIGPSGCGKSSTLRMAAGLVAPTSGVIRVSDETLERPRKETAFIPQDLGLFPWKTVLQNAGLGLRLHGVAKAKANERARVALAQVGLEGFEGSYPKELSGGMKQRLALARALAMDADLLLMDEPLSAIDALLREALQDTLSALWRARHHTQILVTHSIEEAVCLGERIMVFSDRPATVIADIKNPGVRELQWRNSAPFADRCREVRALLSRSRSIKNERSTSSRQEVVV